MATLSARTSLTGFNDNVSYRGRVYHVQTEHSDSAAPHVSTHVFFEGTILASADAPCGSEEVEVRAVMRAQHDRMRRGLHEGGLDHAIVRRLGALDVDAEGAHDDEQDEPPASATFDEEVLAHMSRHTDLSEGSSSLPPPSRVVSRTTEPPPSLDVVSVDARIRLEPAIALLVRIERLGPDAVGLLRLRKDGGHVGRVLVERGQICWAVADRMATRLTDLLVQTADPPLDPEMVERTYRSCRRRGRPLGEALVEAGLVTAELLRVALLRHCAEALVRLSMSGATATFVPHEAASYEPSFAFGPADLLVAVGALRNRSLAAAARDELAACVPDGALAIAVACADGASIPVALRGEPRLATREIDRLSHAARMALDVARLVEPDTRVVIHRADDGATMVVWARGPLTCFALCADSSEATYVIAASKRRRV